MAAQSFMPAVEGIERIDARLDGAGLRIGIAQARFNPEIGDGLVASCMAALLAAGVAPDYIVLITVPGALELPTALQKLAHSARCDALIALGAVIRGETYHFEVVSNQSAAGIQQVALDAGIPIANGVLTTDTDAQALARVQEKGADCAHCAIEMANLLRALDARRRQR